MSVAAARRARYFTALTMYSTAALTSASDSARLPPLGGIARIPLRAFSCRCSTPCMRWGAHADLSTNFGALATPAEWQAMHIALSDLLPSSDTVQRIADFAT